MVYSTGSPNLGSETMKILQVSYNISSIFGPCVYKSDYELRRFIVQTDSFEWSVIHSFQRFLTFITFLMTVYFAYVHDYILPDQNLAITYSLRLGIQVVILLQAMSIAVDLAYWKIGTALACYANAYIKFMDHLCGISNISKKEQDLDIESEKLLERVLRCISAVTVMILIFTTAAPMFYIQELWSTYLYAVKYPSERMIGTPIPLWFSVMNACTVIVPGFWFIILQSCSRLCAGLQFMFVFAFQTTRIISRTHMKVTTELDSVENGIKTYIRLFLCARCMLSCATPFIIPVILIIALAMGSSLLYFSFGSNGPIPERIFAGAIFLADASCVSALTMFCGELESDSIKLLEVFKVVLNHNLGILDLKLLYKTLKPIRVQAGQAYNLHKISVVEFWDNVIDKTVFLLCAFPLTK